MISESQPSFTLNGAPIEVDLVERLDTADLDGDLAGQLERNGYLLMRGVHDADAVEAARREVLHRLAEVGEVRDPVIDGIASGASRRREHFPTAEDLGDFWRSVSEGEALRAVINGPRIANVMSALFQEPVSHFSFAWLRAMIAGRGSPLHIDHPYMNRGSARLVTCWTPLCPIGLSDGSLYVLEESHKWPDIREQFEGHDVDRDQSRPGHFEEGPIALARAKQCKLLTSEFELGDCLIFGMFTAHGSFDNNSKAGRIRLSCDTRFQPTADAMDDRFSGPHPPAHGGLGYGCLSASKPMTETSALR